MKNKTNSIIEISQNDIIHVSGCNLRSDSTYDNDSYEEESYEKHNRNWKDVAGTALSWTFVTSILTFVAYKQGGRKFIKEIFNDFLKKHGVDKYKYNETDRKYINFGEKGRKL